MTVNRPARPADKQRRVSSTDSERATYPSREGTVWSERERGVNFAD